MAPPTMAAMHLRKKILHVFLPVAGFISTRVNHNAEFRIFQLNPTKSLYHESSNKNAL